MHESLVQELDTFWQMRRQSFRDVMVEKQSRTDIDTSIEYLDHGLRRLLDVGELGYCNL
jgi:hypothetical protein